MIKKINKPSEITLSNIFLLIFTFTLIFLIPLFPDSIQENLTNILFSTIFFLAIFSIKSVFRKHLLVFAILVFIIKWVAEFLTLDVLNYISSLSNVVFFQLIVIKLIIQIAGSKKVHAGVILESVNAYLLLGLMFTTLVAILHLYDEHALGVYDNAEVDFQHYIYYTFVTMSTLGYGDITPQESIGKSLSILISISGQLYVAIIIAMLIGKFAGSEARSKK